MFFHFNLGINIECILFINRKKGSNSSYSIKYMALIHYPVNPDPGLELRHGIKYDNICDDY